MQNLTTVPVSVCFIVDQIDDVGYSLWLQKRDDTDESLNQKWEAPGGKWEADETPLDACIREVKEETGVDLSHPVFFKDYFWENGDKLISLHTFLATNAKMNEKGKWFQVRFDNPLKELENNIPPINHQIIEEMSKYIKLYKETIWEA